MLQANAPATYANGGSRTAAWAIDASIVVMLAAVLGWAVSSLDSGWLILAAILVAPVAYAAFMRLVLGGTGGELALTIRAVHLDGSALSPLHAIARLALGISLPFLVPGLISWAIHVTITNDPDYAGGFDGFAILFFWALTWVFVPPAWAALQIGLASTGKRQAIQDMILRTVVVDWRDPRLAPAPTPEAPGTTGMPAPREPVAPVPQPVQFALMPDGTVAPIAGFGDRFGAAFIDLLVAWVPALILASAMPWWMTAVFALLVGLGIEAVLAMFGKPSMGKSAVGLRVVTASGAQLDSARAAFRAMVRWLLPIAVYVGAMVFQRLADIANGGNFSGWPVASGAGFQLIIGGIIAHIVMVAASNRHEAIHDRLAKTLVVRPPKTAPVRQPDVPQPG